MPSFGLIGHKISHSFSKEYFTEKFRAEGLTDYRYDLYPLESIGDLLPLLKAHPALKGLNVTIPYKQVVIPYLDEIDPNAEAIGAVNVINIVNGKLQGHNSDFYGFKSSLTQWLPDGFTGKALILGTGGASKAVAAALLALNIDFKFVSRSRETDVLNYDQQDMLDAAIQSHHLIINTTPLGMHPNTETHPDINYNTLTADHYLYDLVYNPKKTQFLALGENRGARIKNGLEMLHLQAEKSWDIWMTQTSLS